MNLDKSRSSFQIRWLEITCSVILLCLPLPYLLSRGLPYVYNDEFGYWASAAAFVGLDWSGIFSSIPYYSYGYSLFLSPLLLIFQSTSAAYRAALMLNGVWVCGAFWALRGIVRHLFPDISPRLRAILAFACALFSSNLTQVNFTWPETLLFFLYCLIFYLVVLAAQQPRLWYYPLLAALCLYSYTVHQRTLGILVSVVLFVVWQWAAGKAPFRCLLAFWGVFAALFGAHILLKDFVQQHIWAQTASNVLAANEMSGQLGKLQLIFSLEGLQSFILSLCGKIFYIAAASGLLLFVTASRCARTLWDDAAFAFRARSLRGLNPVNCFLFLSVCSTVVIAAVFMILPQGVVHLYYGRYSDNVMGVIVLLALCSLYQNRLSFHAFVHSVAVFLLLTLTAAYYQLQTGLSGETSINTAGIGPFLRPERTHLALLFLCAAGVFTLFFLLQRIPLRLSVARRSAVMAVVYLCVWCMVGGWSHAHFISTSWSDAPSSSQAIADSIIQISDSASPQPIYVMTLDEGHYPTQYAGNGIRFLLPRREISLWENRAPNDLPEEYFLVVPVGRSFQNDMAVPIKVTNSYQLFLVSKGTVSIPSEIYEGLVHGRRSIGAVQFSETFSCRLDESGQVAAGMILDNYQPKDDSVSEMAKAGIRYVQVTNRALAEKMIAAGIPLEEHLFLPLRYTAAELNTNGHTPNRADEPIALRNGLVQFGPYCTLGKGVYRITVEGSGFAEHTKVRVQSGVGGKDHDIVLEQASEDKVVYQLPLEGAFENLEFCMTGIDSETVKISSLTIELLDAGSEEIIPADRLPLAQLRDEDGWTPVTAAMQQQIEALTGRHMDTNTYAAARALDLAAMVLDGDAAFSDGAVALRQGGVLRGPGEALDAGTYRVTVTGDNLTRAEFSLLTGGGETKVPVQYLSSTPGKVVYLVTLGAEVLDAEYAAYSTDTAYPVTITGIQVEQAVG